LWPLASFTWNATLGAQIAYETVRSHRVFPVPAVDLSQSLRRPRRRAGAV